MSTTPASALLLLCLAACSGGRAGRPVPDVPPTPDVVVAPEPLIALNIQPPSASQADTVGALLWGARVATIRVSWWPWSTPESWAWLPAYRAAGAQVLPLVYPSDDAHAAETLAGRYRALVEAFGPFPYVQLGNEVDGAGPWSIPGADPYTQGRRWANVLRRASRLIRTFDPAAKIVAGGVAWVHPGTLEWVRGLVEGGGFDVLAIHVYGIGCAGEPLSRVDAVREEGWTGPVWATEVGVHDGQARYLGRDPDTFQAEQIRLCLSEDPSRLKYERLYWFQLTPDPSGYGILRPDFSARPAYDWLQARGN